MVCAWMMRLVTSNTYNVELVTANSPIEYVFLTVTLSAVALPSSRCVSDQTRKSSMHDTYLHCLTKRAIAQHVKLSICIWLNAQLRRTSLKKLYYHVINAWYALTLSDHTLNCAACQVLFHHYVVPDQTRNCAACQQCNTHTLTVGSNAQLRSMSILCCCSQLSIVTFPFGPIYIGPNLQLRSISNSYGHVVRD